MPYIALQLVGMKVVFAQLGGPFAVQNGLPALTIAFALLAAYTYTSGLRAPAMIALVKDTMIYITVIAAVIVIPIKLGGWGHIFSAAAAALPTARLVERRGLGHAKKLTPSVIAATLTEFIANGEHAAI